MQRFPARGTVVAGVGNMNSRVPVVLDTPTTLALKLNQVTGDWRFWINPDLDALEPSTADLSGNNPGIIDGIGSIRLRGGRYANIPVNTNVTNYTDVALFTGGDIPFFVPEPSTAWLLALGGLAFMRRRR